MVNYKDKIQELKQKGIFSEKQAEKLSNSFEVSKSDEIVTQKKYTLEMLGVILLSFAGLYITFFVGSVDNTQIVENTASTLNAPITSGLSSGNSFIIIVILLSVLGYLLLYFLAHNRYNALYSINEKIRDSQQIIHNTNVMKTELGTKIEALLKEQEAHEKESKPDMQINITTQSSSRKYVMQIYTSLEEDILSFKNQLALLETKCSHMQNRFPNNLAKLVGKLPQCTK